ncbi:MAG: hypothetical protein U1E96_08790 [Azonexus sp.]
MQRQPFISTELKDTKERAFINGDDAAGNKNLTDDRVAQSALRAVFHDRPDYFVKKGGPLDSEPQ